MPPILQHHSEPLAYPLSVFTPFPSHKQAPEPSITPILTLSSIPAPTLIHHSNTLKNARFRNVVPHNYPLRYRTRIKYNTGTNFRHLAAQHLAAHHIYQPKVHHIFTAGGNIETINTLFNSINRSVRTRSLSNEWGRLAQGKTYNVCSTYTINLYINRKYQKDTE